MALLVWIFDYWTRSSSSWVTMSRVKHIKRADRGYRNNTHYQTRAMLHSTHRARQHNAAYSQTARRPAKPPSQGALEEGCE